MFPMVERSAFVHVVRSANPNFIVSSMLTILQRILKLAEEKELIVNANLAQDQDRLSITANV